MHTPITEFYFKSLQVNNHNHISIYLDYHGGRGPPQLTLQKHEERAKVKLEDATIEESSTDPQPHLQEPANGTTRDEEPERRSTTDHNDISPAPPFNVNCTEIYDDNLLLSWDHTDNAIMDKFMVEARDLTVDNSEWNTVAETESGMVCSIKVNDMYLLLMIGC